MQRNIDLGTVPDRLFHRFIAYKTDRKHRIVDRLRNGKRIGAIHTGTCTDSSSLDNDRSADHGLSGAIDHLTFQNSLFAFLSFGFRTVRGRFGRFGHKYDITSVDSISDFRVFEHFVQRFAERLLYDLY